MSAIIGTAVVNGRGGRFAGTGELTGRQRTFVRALVRNGGRVAAAAREAGYGDRSRGYEALRVPHVADALRRERQRMIDVELAGIAAGTMRDLLVDESTPAPTRYQAAKWCLEQAGHKSDGIQQLMDSGRSLSEMTLEELDAFVRAGTDALSELDSQRRRTIDISPSVDDTDDTDNTDSDSADTADIVDADNDVLD